MRAELERVVEVLAGIGGGGRFATTIELDASVLGLRVEGAGWIRLPVSDAAARALVKVATPAKYGKGTKTLTDRRVRDTWVIARSRIAIDPGWDEATAPMLDEIRERLGLGETTTLRAELHDMLVYERGQFFVAHQDSEKHDDMIGTLVVMLPSSSSGGEMEIAHRGETVAVRGSRDALVCVAFYADCRHEVRPVTSGYRVVLTFTLRATAKRGRARRVAEHGVEIEQLATSVQAHFDAPLRERYGRKDRPRAVPDRLVFLLDHEYTERGLEWSRLKSGDAVRAAALREVATLLDCDVSLAQADVHENWGCETDYDGRSSWRSRRWSRARYPDDEEDEGGSLGSGEPDHPALVDLFATEIELRDPAAKRGAPKAEYVDAEAEVCWIKPSVECKTFNWSHEGYTGNAGDTVDRWYHRGAVVLVPRGRAFVVLAKRDPAKALAQLGKVIERDAARAREMIRELAPIWANAVRSAKGNVLARAIEVAGRTDDAAAAAVLLGGFESPQLDVALGEQCAALAKQYGATWCGEIVRAWGEEADRMRWLIGAARFSSGLVTTREGASVAKAWVGAQHRACAEDWRRQGQDVVWIDGRVYGIGREESIASTLRASVIVGRADVRLAIVEWLIGDEGPVPRLAMKVLHAVHAAASEGEAPTIAELQLGALVKECEARLELRVAMPERESDDWSIGWDGSCGCELCAVLEAFLEDETRRVMEWPIGKERRQHVHRKIDAAGLPVTHETRRVGSPQTLVLTKTNALFAREREERAWCAEALVWLRGVGWGG